MSKAIKNLLEEVDKKMDLFKAIQKKGFRRDLIELLVEKGSIKTVDYEHIVKKRGITSQTASLHIMTLVKNEVIIKESLDPDKRVLTYKFHDKWV